MPLLSDYDFDLPKELIAQDPLLNRSDSKLMCLDKKTGKIKHDFFYNIGNYLDKKDTLVINNTKVIPARLFGNKKTGASIEVLLLKRLSENTWECLTRPGRKTLPKDEVIFGDGMLKAKVIDVKEDGIRTISFAYEGVFEEILDKLGQMPLPPYITHELEDKSRYQTVYAKFDGSAAAPTAGLHFTPKLINEIKSSGVNVAEITLHVGLGTFRPVKEENLENHVMHREQYVIEDDAAELINKTKKDGGRVIAVGTTTVRTLETVARILEEKNEKENVIAPFSGDTDIFIYPGFDFKVVDGIITNFHLPKSTLLMLVSAFYSREKILEAYSEAIEKKYRFFSFGDAMLIS